LGPSSADWTLSSPKYRQNFSQNEEFFSDVGLENGQDFLAIECTAKLISKFLIRLWNLLSGWYQ
jgi:hypothetical protein